MAMKIDTFDTYCRKDKVLSIPAHIWKANNMKKGVHYRIQILEEFKEVENF